MAAASRLFLAGRRRFTGTQRKDLVLVNIVGLQNYSSTDTDYLHKSIITTNHFQKSLPRLPIPKLEKTCERYLQAQKPLLSSDEYQRTEKSVKSFLQNEGPKLHTRLVAEDKKNKHTSYISGPWYDMYLRDRRPVVLNFNPFMVFVNDSRSDYNQQLIRATNLVVSSVRFMKTLKANLLEPEVFHLNPKKSDTQQFRQFVRLFPQSLAWYGAYLYKAFPLDMSQYTQLFNSTRIPRQGKDEIYSDPSKRHLLVMNKGHVYIFDVLDESGTIKPAEEIMAHLKYIIERQQPAAEHPVGMLTTENRDVWAHLRDQLVASGNEALLKHMDSALFALLLDSKEPGSPNQISRAFLHSDGVNRWFDKCFQLIVSPEGKAGVNFEHSWGDGVAILRYVNETFKDSTENPAIHPGTLPATAADSSQLVQQLEFKLDPTMKQAIKEARSKFEKSITSLDLHHLDYGTFTKSYVKSKKLSPDSIMQLAIQMAFYKQSLGKTAATYESCSTAAFKHGRTETVRPATTATKGACELILSGKSTSEEMLNAIQQCSKLHMQLTKEAAMGQGFDRHLFALKLFTDNQSLPGIYADPAYQKINHIILSTSTLSSPAVVIGGFAPVVPNGYGIGYVTEDSRIGFNVTAYQPHRDPYDFINCLKDSMDNIYSILEGTPL